VNNISKGDLNPIQLANSTEVDVGQKITTIGSPSAIPNLVTEKNILLIIFIIIQSYGTNRELKERYTTQSK
jgi:hypothetical protein